MQAPAVTVVMEVATRTKAVAAVVGVDRTAAAAEAIRTAVAAGPRHSQAVAEEATAAAVDRTAAAARRPLSAAAEAVAVMAAVVPS